MSRHRKIRLSRSKAIVIAAAGALSVATVASAAATSSHGTGGHAAGSDRPAEVAHEAAGLPRLSVADQLARPVAEARNQQGDDTPAQHALRLRLTQVRAAIAQRRARERTMSLEKILPHHLERKAILYVRPSSAHQVLHNRESSALQYAMRDRLTSLGWSTIETVDDDLGRSAAVASPAPGSNGW